MVTFTPDFEILPGTAPSQRQVPPWTAVRSYRRVD